MEPDPEVFVGKRGEIEIYILYHGLDIYVYVGEMLSYTTTRMYIVPKCIFYPRMPG